MAQVIDDNRISQLKKLISIWKEDGFIKCTTEQLSWHDVIRVIDHRGTVILGTVCKIYKDSKYILITNDSEQFQKIFFNQIVKLYYSKYIKPTRQSLSNYLPKDFLDSDD